MERVDIQGSHGPGGENQEWGYTRPTSPFSTGAAMINGSQHPSSSSSVNDVSSMSTDPTLASDTDSSLETSAGPLGCCRWLLGLLGGGRGILLVINRALLKFGGIFECFFKNNHGIHHKVL